MKIIRSSAACVFFQGNIVVSGGMDNYDWLNTVESYDVFANKLKSMPNMIKRHSFNSLVTVKDKLFVIGYGRDMCEVFDNVCMKFVALDSCPFLDLNKAISIGNKIVIFQDNSTLVICYDVDKDEWCEESREVTKCIQHFACAKLPWF